MTDFLAPAKVGTYDYLAPAVAPNATSTPTATTPVRFDFPASYPILAAVFEPPSDITSVIVTPASVTIPAGVEQLFIADVTGVNNPNKAVTWFANAGSITSAGVFTAPASTAEEQRIVIRATSVQDSQKWGEALAVIPALVIEIPPVDSVEVTPAAANVDGGGTVQFSAKVFGPDQPSQEVTWSTNLGTISTAGLVTAPAGIAREQLGTVTATSVRDPSKKSTALFVVAAQKESPTGGFVPSAARTVRILPGRQAFTVGSHWVLGTAGPVGGKDPNSTIDIPFDWSAWLTDIGEAKLSKVEFLLGGGLQSEDVIPTLQGGAVLVSGGTPGTSATVTCRITTATSPSRTEDRTVVLQIRDQ